MGLGIVGGPHPEHGINEGRSRFRKRDLSGGSPRAWRRNDRKEAERERPAQASEDHRPNRTKLGLFPYPPPWQTALRAASPIRSLSLDTRVFACSVSRFTPVVSI